MTKPVDKGALLLLGLAVGLTLAEVAARAFWNPMTAGGGVGCYRLSDNPRLRYDMVPGCSPIDAYPIGAKDRERLNSLGMRDVEPRIAPRAVTVIGDSISYGSGVRPEETWPKRLEKSLPDTAVYNLAVPGYATFQEVEMLRVRGEDLPYAGTVILQYYMNDDDRFNLIWRDLLAKMTPAQHRTYADWLRVETTYHSRLVALVRIALFTPTPAATEVDQDSVYTSLLRLRQIVAARGQRLLVVIFPHAYGDADQQGHGALDPISAFPSTPWQFDNRKMESMATELDLPMVDLAADIYRRPRLASIPGRRIFRDGCCHLTALGHKIAAWIIRIHLRLARTPGPLGPIPR